MGTTCSRGIWIGVWLTAQVGKCFFELRYRQSLPRSWKQRCHVALESCQISHLKLLLLNPSALALSSHRRLGWTTEYEWWFSKLMIGFELAPVLDIGV